MDKKNDGLGAQIVLLMLLPLLVLAVMAMVGVVYQIPVPMLSRDPTALGRLHPLAGLLSTLGVLLWCATAAVCLFSASIGGRLLAPPVRRFVLSAGLLSLYLMVDDAFQFHEDLSPNYLGLRERYVYLLLATAVAAYLFNFRHLIWRSRWWWLLLGLGGLGASAMADTLLLAITTEALGDWQYFVEDSFKWLGICCWAGYHMLSCADALAGRLDAVPQTASAGYTGRDALPVPVSGGRRPAVAQRRASDAD